MNDINLPDVIEIVVAQMARFSDSGVMAKSGASFFDTPHEIVIEYNTAQLPYIIYQEEGFTHYWRARSKNPAVRAKAFINVNQGFISVDTVGQLTRYGWSKALGIEFNKLENDQILLENQSKMLEELGATYQI